MHKAGSSNFLLQLHRGRERSSPQVCYIAMIYLTAFFTIGFCLIHLLIGRLHFLDVAPRSRWLSAAGGIAVAYVFLHVLPELSAHQSTFAQGLGVAPEVAESWVFLVALVGLASFYGLERLAKTSRGRSPHDGAQEEVAAGLFRIHLGSFAVYNLLIGYLLVDREETGLWPLMIYFLAMAMHFVTVDFGLREDHKERYDTPGRWILVAAVCAGWVLALVVKIPELATGLLFAFLAGGVVLNVLKEELPEERQSRFWPFALAAAGYAALLIAA